MAELTQIRLRAFALFTAPVPLLVAFIITGVTVITTLDDEGQPHSMTANAFSSICLDPPTVMVCIAHGTHTYGYVENTGRVGVNILKQEQQGLGASIACFQESHTQDIGEDESNEKNGSGASKDSKANGTGAK